MATGCLKTVSKWLLAAALILVGLSAAPFDARSGGKPRTQPADPNRVGVIIALGVGHDDEGKPSQRMVQRVGTAVQHYKAGRAKYILVCGGYTTGHVAEAEEMKIIAMALGVPDKAILVENGSISTVQNARNAQLIIDSRRFRSALLVTHKSHMKRALKAFKEVKRLRHIHKAYADGYVPAELSLKNDQELPPFSEIQAVIIHGKSVELDFRSDTLKLDRTQLSLARTVAWLYQKGLTEVPYFIWHKACGTGHMTRAEIIGLAAIAHGVPARMLRYAQARRFGRDKLGLFEICKKNGWTKVLAILPRERADDQELVEQQYSEAGIAATVVLALE